LASVNVSFFCSEELFTTGGATHGINMLSSVFFEGGDTIYVEDPSYFMALDIFTMYNFNIVGGKNKTTYCAVYVDGIFFCSSYRYRWYNTVSSGRDCHLTWF